MIHSACDWHDLFIAQFIDGSGRGAEDGSAQPQRPEIALSEREECSLFGEDDIMFFSASDLVNFISFQRHDDFMYGQYFFALVLQVILIFGVEGSDNIFGF